MCKVSKENGRPRSLNFRLPDIWSRITFNLELKAHNSPIVPNSPGDAGRMCAYLSTSAPNDGRRKRGDFGSNGMAGFDLIFRAEKATPGPYE